MLYFTAANTIWCPNDKQPSAILFFQWERNSAIFASQQHSHLQVVRIQFKVFFPLSYDFHFIYIDTHTRAHTNKTVNFNKFIFNVIQQVNWKKYFLVIKMRKWNCVTEKQNVKKATDWLSFVRIVRFLQMVSTNSKGVRTPFLFAFGMHTHFMRIMSFS